MFDDKTQSNNQTSPGANGLNEDKSFPFQKVDDQPQHELAGNKGPVEDILASTENEDKPIKHIEPEQPVEKEPEPGLKETFSVPSMQGPGAQTPIVPPTSKPKSALEIQTPPPDLEAPIKKSNKLFTIILIVLIVIILGLASVFAYQYFTKNSAQPSTNTNADKSLQELLNTLNQPQDINANQNTEPTDQKAVYELDTDGDGLTDQDEIELGTNPNKFDTDNDGLSDFEEVEIYQTDPIHPDTDRDTFLDGDEVKGGYDPLKQGGKL